VEKAFRMAKSDLAARPIFHYNTEAIRVHMLICFIALIMARSIEITTGSSLRNVIDTLWPISHARLHLPSTGKISMLRAPISNQAAAFLKRLGVPY
jgi:transposase